MYVFTTLTPIYGVRLKIWNTGGDADILGKAGVGVRMEISAALRMGFLVLIISSMDNMAKVGWDFSLFVLVCVNVLLRLWDRTW